LLAFKEFSRVEPKLVERAIEVAGEDLPKKTD
jgi:hypothetical protein